MADTGKKLGILISAGPTQPTFRHGVRLAGVALDRGCRVYLYCIDDGVRGLADPELQALRHRGLNLFACALAAERCAVSPSDLAVFCGLTVLSDILAATDRFISFN